MKKFRFRQFKVYKDVMNFNRELKQTTKKYFPREEQFSLTSQLWRASDSVVFNIAEGSDRGTDKDFAHFLNNAHTSLNEVIACMDLAFNNNYISEDILKGYLIKAENLANQLTAFRKRLIESPTK